MTEANLFQTQGYLLIKNAVSTEHCQMLSDYALFRLQVAEHVRKKDALARVHREYGDSMMELLLDKLTATIEAATGKSLWPTLSFYYVYREGNELARHKDRSCCQIVASLCINADPTFKKTEGTWPLMLRVEGQAQAMTVNYGDLLIFKGSEQEHWRDKFNGAWFVSAIFAYVDKTGPFAFQKYDQRQSLGRPHIGMLRWSLGCLKNQLFRRSRHNNTA